MKEMAEAYLPAESSTSDIAVCFLLTVAIRSLGKMGFRGLARQDALQLFDEMADRDANTWNVTINGLVKTNRFRGRLEIFQRILEEKVEPNESAHETFGVGHSSISISVDLRIVVASDLLVKKNHVVTVIGDGAITAGQAFEAMNNSSYLDSNLIVVLNENNWCLKPPRRWCREARAGIFAKVERKSEHKATDSAIEIFISEKKNALRI
ncbi:hypothetical protein J5N97_022545 [Dioscorea zingiberensis]|uniref:Uncharacterized protein n=1 Tax=Dioscorea zingiberensis TaxID=325984 RepID=A0A9D5CBF0_9LILI|nr:hypothetical protein J5N97_022545 [Dioscorea zingiberensis]